MKTTLVFEFGSDEGEDLRKCQQWQDSFIALDCIQELGFKARKEGWCTCRWIREINAVLYAYEILQHEPRSSEVEECDCL